MSEELLDLTRSLPNLTPREIVEQLDRYIVGQKQAKRACAVALRNRRRRQQVSDEIRDEILPKNILMKGSTGVGKTEIARRLAKLAHAPFIKVEASKFTEVGYVGRDVESIIRDLVEISISMVKSEQAALVRKKAEQAAVEKLLNIYMPPLQPAENLPEEERQAQLERFEQRREKYREMIRNGELNDQKVEIEVPDNQQASVSIFNGSSVEEVGFQLKDMLPGMFGGGGRKKRKSMPIGEALQVIREEEEQNMIDMDTVVKVALERAENSGIVFLDEIDKIAGSGRQGSGPDVSRGGVQRDLLPIIEGSTINTKYGMVNTDHILFIAAGAFHVSKVSDLLPELQGRLPIRVELEPLTEEDFKRILVEPRNSLIRQNTALVETEEVQLSFTDDGVAEIARVAFDYNENRENIGARRLHAVMEKVLEDLFFDASEMAGEQVVVDRDYVLKHLGEGGTDSDLHKYIL
jgi:ATP-dependent HslUV protease ATP-binding subunit HslU